MTEEIKLLQAAIHGDTAAFEQIVKKYQSLVCAITFSGTGRVDISEELAQDTFLSVWKNLGQLKELNNFRPWLCTIARNMLTRYYRKKIPIPLDSEKLYELADQTPNPSEMLITQEEQTMLDQTLMRIPAEYREPLVLFYRQDQSIHQVAEALGLTEAAVRTRMYRARQMLREEIAGRLERTLERTAPGKAFTRAVMVAVGGAAIGLSANAAAAAANAAGTTTSAGISGLMSTFTAKLITAAAVVTMAVGGVIIYRYGIEKSQRFLPADSISIEQDRPTTIASGIEETAQTLQYQAARYAEKNLDNDALVSQVEIDLPAAQGTESVRAADITGEVQNNEYVFEAKGVLSGLITDTHTGEPVTNAEVTLGPGRLYRAKTDKNGFYSFEKIDKDGDYSIGVYSNDYIGLTDSQTQPKMHLKKTDRTVMHFQLEMACMLELYISDQEGKPVEDADVWISSLADENGVQIGRSYASQKTDENGYILLGGFTPSDKPYVITSLHYTEGNWIEKYGQKYRESVPDFAPGYLKVTLTDPNVIEYGEIVLQKGIQVQGTAKYPDGTPAKECKIMPYPDWWHSTTCPPAFAIDPNGVFVLHHITPGTYRIQASIPTGEGSGSSIGINLVTMQLPSEKPLDVTVPEKPTSNRYSSRDEVTEAKLYGIVVDALTGKPVTKYQLRYQRISNSYYTSDGVWTQFNNDKGDFALDLIGGQHAVCRVQAVAEGYSPQWSEIINSEDKKAVVIRLAAGGSITGRVVDANGNPVANAKIVPYSLGGDVKPGNEPVFASETGAVTTNNSGHFTLSNSAAGTEILKITHPDYTFATVSDISVQEGRQTDIGNVVLRQGGILEGIVYDHQGKPQAGVTLYAQNHFSFSTSEIRHATVITDPNGYYRMDNLPQEMCYLVRPRSYELTGVVSRAVVPLNGKAVWLNLGGGPVIRGQLVINGKTLTQTRVTLTLGRSSASGLYRCQADTDENGCFALAAGQPGTYTLAYDRRTIYSTTTTTKLLDIQVGSEDTDLETVPPKGKTLRIWLEASARQMDSMKFFYLCENDPQSGVYIFWQDEPKLSEMPYTINVPGPGRYYAVIRHDSGWGEYQYPIEVSMDQDVMDVALPIQTGHVTITGTLPESINHVFFTNQDRSISGLLYNDKNKRGIFRIEGLFPGTYCFNPKWAYFDDGITVKIPDTQEYTLFFDTTQLQEKLKERVSVHVFDKNGLPAENVAVWIESSKGRLLPSSRDNYSCVFYLPDGAHTIYAEKDGTRAVKEYRLSVDKNKTSSGESYETFIQMH